MRVKLGLAIYLEQCAYLYTNESWLLWILFASLFQSKVYIIRIGGQNVSYFQLISIQFFIKGLSHQISLAWKLNQWIGRTGKNYVELNNFLNIPFLIFDNPSKGLKVVSSENWGGSKIAPIVGYWPGTVALGIILIFKFAVVSYWTYFRFRSVKRN
jgi:hypothetical protein